MKAIIHAGITFITGVFSGFIVTLIARHGTEEIPNRLHAHYETSMEIARREAQHKRAELEAKRNF